MMHLKQTLDHMKTLPPLSVAARKKGLKRLAQAIRDQQAAIIDAISEDFSHRSQHETRLAEIMLSLDEINHNLKHLSHWAQVKVQHSGWKFYPSKCAIVPQPLGVVGIMAPWNYPFNLVMAPLAAAIAAGNRVMVKPSEVTERTADLIKDMLHQVFGQDVVHVVTGDVDVAAAFSQLPLDHILFTGSTQVGKIIMRNASEHLTPVTLELGGKSPVVIDQGYDLNQAARSIVSGKWFNAGQTCIAPDYVLINPERKAELIKAIKTQFDQAYPDWPNNPDFTHIINQQHHQRLQSLLEGVPTEKTHHLATESSQERRFTPCLVDDPDLSSRLMQDEIFGPILPIISSPNIQADLAFINQRARPLTLYLFSNRAATIEQVKTQTTSGSLAVNDTLVQFAQKGLAFGGVGASGMGAYHGVEGFKAMSHMKPVYYQSRLNFNGLARAPFTRLKQRIIAKL